MCPGGTMPFSEMRMGQRGRAGNCHPASCFRVWRGWGHLSGKRPPQSGSRGQPGTNSGEMGMGGKARCGEEGVVGAGSPRQAGMLRINKMPEGGGGLAMESRG